MSDPFLVLKPSEVKKSAQSVLSEAELSDSEFGYFGLGEIYFLERLKLAFSLTGSRVVWPIITVMATAVIGLYSGITGDSLWRGVMSGLITLVVGLIIILVWNYFSSAPKQMDFDLRGNLAAAKQQIREERRKGERAVNVVLDNYQNCFDELQRLKQPLLRFELDVGSPKSQVHLNCPGASDSAEAYSLRATLTVTFHNDDVETRNARKLSFSVINATLGQSWPLTDLREPTLRHPNDTVATPYRGIGIEGSKTSTHYFLDYLVDVPRNCAESLNDDSSLRITMEASRQESFFQGFAVNWACARNENAPLILRGA